MNESQRGSREVKSMRNRHGAEMVLFLVASVVGIYGLGRGLTGLFEVGQGISLIWLAVTGVAFLVLFAQMGRVHDTWPRRQERHAQQSTNEQAAQKPPVQSKESE